MVDDEREPTTPPTSTGRSVLVAVAVGVCVTFAVAGLVYSIIAIPLYLLAQSDPNGLDRPFIRNGFFHVALPAGAVVGSAAGAVIGRWYAKGGRLPTDRTQLHDR